ncbi:MAG: phenylalanine--tRNA ligase subunit alpha [Candidatus Sungbacteria bacterium]|nr:phenylalanine--tRNA ligase subunit alpha [Candidatus Sungbacteria bacterium]
MQNELKRIEKSAKDEISQVRDLNELQKLRTQFLGRERGALTLILRNIKDLPAGEKTVVGSEANRLRTEIEELFEVQERKLKSSGSAANLKKERLDVTRPGVKVSRGHLHPITQVLRQVESIFARMGFTVAEGPEIETEYYNFDALNIPAEHPARDMWDTFWLRGNQKIPNSKFQIPNSQRLLLRTHTSPVQIRYMEKHEPPVRIISPGITYRYEATDASHDIEFWQIEGLLVDKDIHIGHFKAVIQQFFSELFGGKVAIRLRPGYFPFVEPGFEVDMQCVQCRGKGCSVCGKSGWLEMMGAGMVHPAVFKNVGYNPKNVQGFAFGMGLDRIAMMKYKIPDVRLMRSGDLRFLNQF